MLRALPILLLASCNSYDMFALSGFTQESFSPKADILFVIDNSDSMQEEASALATSFASFIGTLGEEQADFPTSGLSDAVSFYSASVDGRSGFVNYQLAIVTTDDEGHYAGDAFLDRFQPDISQDFARNLLCEATCFIDSPGSAPVSCGDPLGDEVSVQWLDCECGASGWQNNCGSAREEPIEAVFMAMCRGSHNPPTACYDSAFSSFSRDEVVPRDEPAFLRPGATLIPVIVSDEGDDSRRMETGDIVPETYQSLFSQFDKRMVWTYIGPDRDADGQFRCGAGQNGSLRIQNFVESTGGLYVPINDAAAGCQARDFDDTLAELSSLLQSLNRSFRLNSLPEEGSIAVYTTDGGAVKPAELLGTTAAGVDEYGDGWSYDRATNTVLLHGDAVPDFDETVQVYYLPVDGNPRDLPF